MVLHALGIGLLATIALVFAWMDAGCVLRLVGGEARQHDGLSLFIQTVIVFAIVVYLVEVI